jgi:hypothetical protein
MVIAQRGQRRAKRLWSVRTRGRDHERDCHQDRPGDRGSRERRPGAHHVRHRPDDRAEQRTDHRGPKPDTEQFAAPLFRSGGREPRQARRPGACAADTLNEPGRVKHRDRRTPAEDQRRRAHQGQAKQRDRAVTEPADGHPAGQRADESSRRVSGDQDASTRLGQALRSRVVGQQRGERGEEDRVDEDERAHEGEQAEHRGIQPQPAPRHPHSVPTATRYIHQSLCRGDRGT